MKIQKILTSPAYNITDRSTGYSVKAGLYNNYMRADDDDDAGDFILSAEYAMPIDMDKQLTATFDYGMGLNDDDVTTMLLGAEFSMAHSYNWATTAGFGYASATETFGDLETSISAMALEVSTTKAVLNQCSVTGTFAIPDPNTTSNPRWRTGKRVFRLTSSSVNSIDNTAVATSAEGDYDAKGLLETTQEAIIATREAQTVRQSVTGNRTTSRVTNRTVQNINPPQQQQGGGGRDNNPDPLAQSFSIDTEDGVFITSVDVYFATKSSTIPVKAEIRNMVNGYPGTMLVPFGRKWLNPGSVNVSTDGTTVTTFTFESPVYLRENIEYCLVLKSDSSDYTVYTARLGDTVLNSDRTVSAQPAVGVLFKSANNKTWSAEQMEDLKFTLKKAVFTTGTATLTLANATLPSKTLATNPIRTFNGSADVRVYHKNHGMHSTTDNVTVAGISSGTYNGIAHSALNGTYTAIKNITLDSYDITSGGTANATGDVGGSVVTATQNRLFDVLQLQIGHVIHPATSLSTVLRTTTGKSVHGSETPFSLEATSNSTSAVLGDNMYFTVPRMIASEINETNEMAGSKSIFIDLTFSSTNANLSPVIDLKRVNVFAISNRLNNPIVSSTDTFKMKL